MDRQPRPAGDGTRVRYARHHVEQSTLYRWVQEHVETFFAESEAAGAPLPRFVRDEFDAFLGRGILAHGSLRLLLAPTVAKTIS